METTEIQKEKSIQEIPHTAEAFQAWITDELGDTELSQKVAAHPEIIQDLIEGKGPLAQPFFEMAREVGRTHPMIREKLVQIALAHGKLLETSFDKVVGNISNKDKDEMLLFLKFRSTENTLLPQEEEREKTPGEKEMIRYANIAIDALRTQFGLASYPIGPEQVHFFAIDELSVGVGGEFDDMRQEARLSETKNEVRKLSRIVHELLHFKGYGAVQADSGADGSFSVGTYRLGLLTVSRPAKDKNSMPYLNQLNEAVTEETTNRLISLIPPAHETLGAIAKQRDEMISKIVETRGDQLRANDFRPHWITDTFTHEDGTVTPLSAYPEERKSMFRLFGKMYDALPGHFEGMTKDEAEEKLFVMLQKAYFTGNILPFGRLFNELFGHGKFREFGHLLTNEEQEKFIENL